MKPKISPFFLCKLKNRPDAACRKLPRCTKCGRVLRFSFADSLCPACASETHYGRKVARHGAR